MAKVNVQKYLFILENVLNEEKQVSPEKFINKAIEIIEKQLQLTLDNLITVDSNSTLQKQPKETELIWKLVCYLNHILLTIKNNVTFSSSAKEDLISVQHRKCFINTMKISINYGIIPYLEKSFKQFQCFKINNYDITKYNNLSIDIINNNLEFNLNVFVKLFEIKEIIIDASMEYLIMAFIAGQYSLVYNLSKEITPNNLINQQNIDRNISILNEIVYQNIPKENSFKYLLILKSIKLLPSDIQKCIHKDLLKMLTSANGFYSLCKILLKSDDDDDNGNASENPLWKRYECLYNIIAHPGHDKRFYLLIIDQISTFMQQCLNAEEHNFYINGCIGCLNHLYKKNTNINVRTKIEHIFLDGFEQLYKPKDLLTGSILLDNKEFRNLIYINYMAFGHSTSIPLRSQMLINYLPLLFQLYNLLYDNLIIQKQLASIIIQCLANRNSTTNELTTIIDAILFEKYNKIALNDLIDMKILHPRIILKYNNTNHMYSVQIGPINTDITYDAAEVLTKILKKSEHNQLIYKIFLHLLNSLESCINSNELLQTELITDIEELTTIMSVAFKKRIAIISSLTALINYKPFHCLFNDNPNEILIIFKNLLLCKIKQSCGDKSKIMEKISDNEIMIIILTIILEFIGKLKILEINNKNLEFINVLKEYQIHTMDNPTIQHLIVNILDLLNIKNPASQLNNNESSDSGDYESYEIATKLCEENEPHLKVYGIMQLIKLITNQDIATISNKHRILALALHLLKSDDSYAFLNCIKLLVVLVDILESDVLEALIYEYQNDDYDIDYRLKIGEVIVKVTEGLGPLSYKYKDILINCLLCGCTNKIDEYRLTSLSNLGTICRILSYQIHNFFHELMSTIESLIKNDKFVPVRRAAVMVLAHILCGIDDLIQFEDILLPIYRLLKYVAQNETDEHTRLHADIGLDHLTQQIKLFLTIDKNKEIRKEIRIFGIKDEAVNTNNKRNKSILELN